MSQDEDPLAVVRGLIAGVLLSLVFWSVLFFGWWCAR
jgi:hypothetical protein